MADKEDVDLSDEIQKMKLLMEEIKRNQMIFSNTFTSIPPKERVAAIRKIQNDHTLMQSRMDQVRKFDIGNAGQRFAVENLKQSFQVALKLWKKIEKNLENFMLGVAQKTLAASQPLQHSVTQQAVDNYVVALKNLGHAASPEMVTEFKTRLESAYTKAKAQAGGKDLDIKIVQEGQKIKVQMAPKKTD